MDTIDEQIEKLRQQKQHQEWQTYLKDVRPKLKEYVGRCYKYRNSYGGDSKGWWLYEKVTDFVEDDHVRVDYLLVEKVQLDENGFAELKSDYIVLGPSLSTLPFKYDYRDYKEIDANEYESRRGTILAELFSKTSLRRYVLNDER